MRRIIRARNLGPVVSHALGTGLLVLLSISCVAQGTYDDVVAANQELNAKVADAAEQTANLAAEIDELRDAQALLEDEVGRLDSARTALTGALADATRAIDELTRDNDELQSQLASTKSDLSEVTALHLMLTTRYDALQASYQALAANHAELEASAGELQVVQTTVESLSLQAEVLRAEIESLEAQRQPLIVDSYVGTFACTGSMEPKITCLDSATWLDNFDPSDITVGTIISFRPVAACGFPPGRNVAHRVVAIEVIYSVLHFRAKGDANLTEDPCWIPTSNVNGYLIELREDTHPENAPLRNQVNGAKEAYLAALSAYRTKSAEYQAFVTAYCPGNVCPSPYYDQAVSLYDETQALYGALQNAIVVYEAALDLARSA